MAISKLNIPTQAQERASFSRRKESYFSLSLRKIIAMKLRKYRLNVINSLLPIFLSIADTKDDEYFYHKVPQIFNQEGQLLVNLEDFVEDGEDTQSESSQDEAEEEGDEIEVEEREENDNKTRISFEHLQVQENDQSQINYLSQQSPLHPSNNNQAQQKNEEQSISQMDEEDLCSFLNLQNEGTAAANNNQSQQFSAKRKIVVLENQLSSQNFNSVLAKPLPISTSHVSFSSFKNPNFIAEESNSLGGKKQLSNNNNNSNSNDIVSLKSVIKTFVCDNNQNSSGSYTKKNIYTSVDKVAGFVNQICQSQQYSDHPLQKNSETGVLNQSLPPFLAQLSLNSVDISTPKKFADRRKSQMTKRSKGNKLVLENGYHSGIRKVQQSYLEQNNNMNHNNNGSNLTQYPFSSNNINSSNLNFPSHNIFSTPTQHHSSNNHHQHHQGFNSNQSQYHTFQRINSMNNFTAYHGHQYNQKNNLLNPMIQQLEYQFPYSQFDHLKIFKYYFVSGNIDVIQKSYLKYRLSMIHKRPDFKRAFKKKLMKQNQENTMEYFQKTAILQNNLNQHHKTYFQKIQNDNNPNQAKNILYFSQTKIPD